MIPPDLPQRLRRLRALVLDVDGVLTDGGMYYGPAGEPLKRFDIKDGMGLRRLREAGLRIAFITGEKSRAVLLRAQKLGVKDVRMGVEDKGAEFLDLLKDLEIHRSHVAYMGDDVNDLPPLTLAGVAIAVADAVPEVLRAAEWVTSRPGGRGAVREVCDAILIALKSARPAVR